MDGLQRYTISQMREMISYLLPIFDVVRLVDPRDTAVLTLSEDGTVSREPYTCFRVWNKECRCENCTSIQAALDGCQRTKYEFIQENAFFVVSRPLVLVLPEGETPVILEIVIRVSDQLLLEKEHGKSLAERLAETRELLYQDELTKVYNRRYLNELNFLYQGMKRISDQLGVIMLDLRQFKRINDTQGHLAGDQLLRNVADALRARVRSTDSVIRLGGDEFLVMLPGCREEDVPRVVEKLRQAVETVTSADFGYTYTSRFHATQEELKRLLEEADCRMYEEKRRNAE